MPVFECSYCNDMTYSAFPGAAGACGRCGGRRLRVIDGAFDQARVSERRLSAGDHATVVFDDPQEVAAFCARFLEAGIVDGERVIACVFGALKEAVTVELRSAAADVEWQDPREVYADFDVERVAALYDDLLAADPRTTRILAALDGECLMDIPAEDFDRYERRAHDVVTSHGANVLCAYDASSLSHEMLEVAARRHTLEVTGGAARRNERFEYQPA